MQEPRVPLHDPANQAPLDWDGEGPPPPGHNQPPEATTAEEPPTPEELLEAFRTQMVGEFAAIRKRSIDQQVGVEKITEINDDNAANVTDFIGQARAIGKELAKLKDELKKPHKERGDIVQALFNAIQKPLKERLDTLNAAYTDYVLAKEKAEQERQHAEQQAQEAAAKEAREKAEALEQTAIEQAKDADTEEKRDAAVATLDESQKLAEQADQAEDASIVAARLLRAGGQGTTRGDYGSTGYVRKDNWKFEITDADQVPREYCSPDPAKIRAKVQAEKRVLRIPGVRVFNDRKAVVKGR